MGNAAQECSESELTGHLTQRDSQGTNALRGADRSARAHVSVQLRLRRWYLVGVHHVSLRSQARDVGGEEDSLLTPPPLPLLSKIIRLLSYL